MGKVVDLQSTVSAASYARKGNISCLNTVFEAETIANPLRGYKGRNDIGFLSQNEILHKQR